MMSSPLNVATRLKDYQTPTLTTGKEKEGAPSSSILSSYGPLDIERANLDSAIQPPSRGVLWKSSYNPNARFAQHYNIIEDLAQVPSAKSALKFLQSYSFQQKALLSDIGDIDPSDSNLIYFDLENHIPCLPHHISFLIEVIINERNIHKIVIDEGASTCIMFVSCWKEISSPTLNQSSNTLEAFHGHDSWPFGVLPNLAITLEGKKVHVEVEIVDANLNYNILLRWSWTHAMHVVASSLFHVLFFPIKGKSSPSTNCLSLLLLHRMEMFHTWSILVLLRRVWGLEFLNISPWWVFSSRTSTCCFSQHDLG